MTITTRHKKAAKNIGKYRTESEALIKSDYSESYALSGGIKKTKGWQSVMEKALPDSLLAKRHKELLDKREVYISKGRNGEQNAKLINQPDTQAVSKGLDMAYKIRGMYVPENNPQKILIINISPEKKAMAEKALDIYLNGEDN